MVTVGDVADFIEELAPKVLAEPWDNVGLQVGRRETSIKRVLVSLDITEAILDEAIARGCEMVLAHHPLFFRDVKGVTPATEAGRVALKAIEAGIAVYIAHTNYDKVDGGVSDSLAAVFGLTDVRVLSPTERLLKLVVFVPVQSLDSVRRALGDAGAGRIGLYSHCAFASVGSGFFQPIAGADPTVGDVGQVNQVEEYKLEVEVDKAGLDKVITSMLKAHPYEEVAYDLYETQSESRLSGAGRVGRLPKAMPLAKLAAVCRKKLSPLTRVAGQEATISTVAVCGGSGASYLGAARDAGAQVLITGDIKYHDALAAVEAGVAVIDAGHDGTELPALAVLRERLRAGLAIEVEKPANELITWRGV